MGTFVDRDAPIATEAIETVAKALNPNYQYHELVSRDQATDLRRAAVELIRHAREMGTILSQSR